MLRPASSARAQPLSQEFRRPAGFCCPPTDEAGHGRVLRMEGTELISVEVIGLAVGLFALTNIDEHLDR